MKKLPMVFLLLLSACVTMSGTYHVYAIDSAGKPINTNAKFVAEGSRIYPVRNALCANHPRAKIIIKDINTDKELEGESGYQCH